MFLISSQLASKIHKELILFKVKVVSMSKSLNKVRSYFSDKGN